MSVQKRLIWKIANRTDYCEDGFSGTEGCPIWTQLLFSCCRGFAPCYLHDLTGWLGVVANENKMGLPKVGKVGACLGLGEVENRLLDGSSAVLVLCLCSARSSTHLKSPHAGRGKCGSSSSTRAACQYPKEHVLTLPICRRGESNVPYLITSLRFIDSSTFRSLSLSLSLSLSILSTKVGWMKRAFGILRDPDLLTLQYC